MKKIKLNSKLYLSKEIITKLQDHQLTRIKGGIAAAGSCIIHTCNTATRK